MSSCPVIKNTIKVARSIQFCKIQGIFLGKDFQNLGEEIEILGKIITPDGGVPVEIISYHTFGFI